MFIEEDAPVSGHPLARNWCVSGVVNEKTGVFVVGGNNPRCGEISREVKKVCFPPPIKRKNKQKLKRGHIPLCFLLPKKTSCWHTLCFETQISRGHYSTEGM